MSDSSGLFCKDERGFSLTELLTVLAIFGLFIAIAAPNASGIYDTFVLRSNSRGIASMLKLGRMKAVSYNRRYIVEYEPLASDVLRGAGACHTSKQIVAVYRSGLAKPTTADECYYFSPKVRATPVPVAANSTVLFEPSGQAKTTAPNAFLLKTRTRCQLVCVNIAGQVQMNTVQSGATCNSSPYGANAETPCPIPS